MECPGGPTPDDAVGTSLTLNPTYSIMSMKQFFATAVSCVILLAGCGGGDEASDGANGSAETAAGDATPAGSASVNGTISFNGTAPAPQPLNLDRECQELREEPAVSQKVVVNDNGTLRWVFVYVKEGLGDQKFAVSREAVELDQEGCTYEPHVLALQTGQTLKILNSDPLLHNIHALPQQNRPFNFGMPNAGMEREESFRVPEVMVRIKCDVHPWMEAWAGVTAHPYHSVSGEDGSYTIENLPAGQYVIEAWHEEFGSQTQNVTVGDGEAVTLDFTFGQGVAAS